MENKTSKYFKYAIGEIILVVIGILIALQINNWNENRKILSAEKTLLINVLQNLSTDSEQFEYYEEQYQQIDELHMQLYKIGIKNEALDSINDPILIRRALYFEQLIGKDFKEKANTIVNLRLRDSLIAYTRLISDLEGNYNMEVKPLIYNQIRPYLRQQKLMNTKNWFTLKERVISDFALKAIESKNLIDKDGLIALSKTKEFQQLLFELNAKWSEFYARLQPVMKANKSLRIIIEQELKNY